MTIFRRSSPIRFVRIISVVCLTLMFALTTLASTAMAAGDGSTYEALGYLPGGLRSSFKFVFAADSHLGYGPANQNTRLALADMADREKDIAFAVVAGDITETGAGEEYSLFKEITSSLPFPVMGAMGNHEARWQDPQGSLLASSVGPRNYSFDCGSWHFVVLDSTHPGQTLGTLEPGTLEWLEGDLRSQPKTRPIAVFAHHPLLYEPARFQDSDDAFASILDKYPVRVVFNAHGHSFIPWKGQGRDFLMTGALMDAAYTVVEVSGSSMAAYSVQVSPDGADRQEIMKLSSRLWNGKRDPRTNPVSKFRVTYKDGTLRGTFDLSQDADVNVQVNGGGYNSLEARTKGSHEFSLDVSGQAKGFHRVRLRVSTSEGPYYAAAEFDKDAKDLTLWRQNLGSAVVGELLPRGSRQVIAGTRDGKVRLMDAQTGSVVWEYDAGSPWGGGVIDGGRLYFGTAKGEVQCLNIDSGTGIWRTSLDTAGFSAAPKTAGLPGERHVYIGSSSGALYRVNSVTGAKVWSFQAKGAIACPPEISDGYVVFGAWDGSLYGVDQETGDGVWTQNLGRQMYYSPYLSPVIYAGRVFATTPYDSHSGGSLLAAFDVSSGQLIWKLAAPVTLMAPSISSASELVVPGADGSLYVFSPWDGSALWRMDGNSTLFSASPGPGPEYVSGGYRGVVNFLSSTVKADFKVSDASLFVSPLILRGAGGSRSDDTLVIQADSQGYIVALRFPR